MSQKPLINEDLVRQRVKETYQYLKRQQAENAELFSAFQPIHVSFSLSAIPPKPLRRPKYMFLLLFCTIVLLFCHI